MPRRNSGDFDPSSLYENAGGSLSSNSRQFRAPPSSFNFPYANPTAIDPLPPRPLSRQSSNESFLMMNSSQRSPLQYASSAEDHDNEELPPPSAPFMRVRSASDTSNSNSSNSVYRQSAGAAIASTSDVNNGIGSLPRNSSMTFRAPFQSPASRASSRPSSQIWNPPPLMVSPAASSTALAVSSKPPMPSTRIAQKLTKEDKPWLEAPSRRERWSWWLTLCCIFLGLGGAAILCWRGIAEVQLLDESSLCLVMDEDWSGGISDDRWTREAGASGFGNGEFQVHTAEDKNAFVRDGELYILPTLMSDEVGRDQIFNDGEYEVANCYYEDSNSSACSVTSNSGTGAVLPPVLSARLITKGKASITGGKVEVRAKLPRGDWLWPAIWMLPEEETYGQWPASGEIDILEARGNQPSYRAQGSNFVRSSLNYGPMEGLVTRIYGWWQMKRGGYDKGFHTYTLEWSTEFIRISVDSRLQAMLSLGINDGSKSFWERGDYPATAVNMTQGSTGEEVVVQNPWAGRSGSAPYDQPFYLIVSLAVGGTSGWFPDSVGDKPWHDSSSQPMTDFAYAQDTWAATWPESESERAFRIDSIKMWNLGGC